MRKKRHISETGVYHVVMRGINKQTIFEAELDYLQYLALLSYYKIIYHYEVYAYCLMSNHVHLLIKTEASLSEIIKSLSISYAYWYNHRYNRVGHLFQGRFLSESVNSDVYFKNVLRYIHQNPVYASIVNEPSLYKWSSYGEYIREPLLCDTCNKSMITDFEKFHDKYKREIWLDYDSKNLSDESARLIIEDVIGHTNIKAVQTYKVDMRNTLLSEMRTRGLNAKQIQRLTGISYHVVTKVRKLKGVRS